MGWQLQAEGKRIRRADPSRIEIGKPDASLTSFSGSVPFGKSVRGLGIDWELRQLFGDVKGGPQVVTAAAIEHVGKGARSLKPWQCADFSLSDWSPRKSQHATCEAHKST